MKMYVISDNTDTQTGMRLTGVEGVVVHELHEFEQAIDAVVADKSIGILLVTEKLAKAYPQPLAKVKLGMPLPLVVEISDRHGTGRTPNSITSYVNEAIGLKV